MTITNAIKELRDKWGYDSTELNHIQELMEEIASETYAIGYLDGGIDAKKYEDMSEKEFVAYGKPEDWN
jgi:hypothetical protein